MSTYGAGLKIEGRSVVPTRTYKWGVAAPTSTGAWCVQAWLRTRKAAVQLAEDKRLPAYAIARLEYLP